MLLHLGRALTRVDRGWSGVSPAEWGGWEGGVPQQANAVDRAPFSCFFARWLALGVPPTALPREPRELRTWVAEELCVHFVVP